MGGNVSLKKRNSTELTAQDIVLIKTSSKLSEQEIRDTYAEFLRECPNGKMTKKAFINFYKKIDPEKATDTVCNGVFRVLDPDGHGRIDFGEFLLVVAILSPGDLDAKFGFMFDMCDVSEDGYADKKEYANWITIVAHIRDETTKDSKTDTVNKGLVTNIAAGISKLFLLDDYKKMSKQEFVNKCKSSPDFVELFQPKK